MGTGWLCAPSVSHQILGINGNFPLADNALIISMEIFDGVLQRNNMTVSGVVNAVNEAGLGGRLTAASRAGDQHHAI